MTKAREVPRILKRLDRSTRNFAHTLKEDLDAAANNDPAATSPLEVALTYPGVHAVWGYRVGHALWNRGLKFPARSLQNLTRFFTGVDIHPAAQLGRRLFIDHAEGVVIGVSKQRPLPVPAASSPMRLPPKSW